MCISHRASCRVGWRFFAVLYSHLIIAELWVTEVGIVAVAVGSGDGLRHEQRGEEQDMIQHWHIDMSVSEAQAAREDGRNRLSQMKNFTGQVSCK